MDEKLVARPPQFNKSTARASPPAMHGPRSDRLAAELRDLLDVLDDLHDTLGNIALEAMFAAEDAGEATPAGQALSAMFFRIDDQRGPLDRATAQLRAIIVRLECPPERIAKRSEAGHG